ASPVDRTTVNVGTRRPFLRLPPRLGGGGGTGPMPAVAGGGAGGVTVLHAGESPCTWGRAAAGRAGRACHGRRCAGEYRRRAVAGCRCGVLDGTADAAQIAPVGEGGPHSPVRRLVQPGL